MCADSAPNTNHRIRSSGIHISAAARRRVLQALTGFSALIAAVFIYDTIVNFGNNLLRQKIGLHWTHHCFLLSREVCSLGIARLATDPSDFLGVPRSCCACNSRWCSVLSAAVAMSRANIESDSTDRRSLPAADTKLHLRDSRYLLRMGPSSTLVIGIHEGFQTTRTSGHPSVVDEREASMSSTSPSWSLLDWDAVGDCAIMRYRI